MALTKLWQVVDADTNRVKKHFLTEGDAEAYLFPNGPFAKNLADLLGEANYTVRPIWTTKSEKDIKELLKKK